MLRQLFRQRGAYNVVNLPIAASQDDPSTSTGRADSHADWRRHYNPALEPEFREDVGLEAWERPNWYTDRRLSSTAAAKILRKRLETYGPQRERNLQEVFSRIRTEKDAEMALKAAELFRRYRASREQHTPFKISTSKMIVQRALEADAGEIAVQALARKDELGFNFISLKAYRQAITHFSSKKDLKNVLKVFDLAKQQGMTPNRDIAFCILRACLDCDRPDMAYAYAVEFQENGLRVSPAQRVLIEAGAGKMMPPFPGDAATEPEVSTDGTEAASGAAAEVVASTETVVTAVMAEADRIIAAAKEGGNILMAENANGAPVGTVSADGEPETVAAVQHAASPSDSAVSEGTEVEAASEQSEATGAGQRAVAAMSVMPEDSAETDAEEGALPSEEGTSVEPFNATAVPGLEEAVTAELQSLMPQEKDARISSRHRRANSI